MVVAIIPSRYGSSRFPGKALAPLAGVPLVVRVAGRVRDAGVADRVIVATDDERIQAVVRGRGIEVWLSRREFRTGSDRVAAALDELGLAPPGCAPPVSTPLSVLNVQGDEALVDRETLEQALAALEGNDLGTVAAPLDSPAEQPDPDTVKVAVDPHTGRARAFSRSPLAGAVHAHVGVYSFTPDALRRFSALPSSAGELAEGLEQLRALEAGMRIGVRTVGRPRRAVNRPADLAAIEALL